MAPWMLRSGLIAWKYKISYVSDLLLRPNVKVAAGFAYYFQQMIISSIRVWIPIFGNILYTAIPTAPNANGREAAYSEL